MRHSIRYSRSVLLLAGILSQLCLASGIRDHLVDVTPFTSTAVIPADADARSIHLESLRMVRLPSRMRYTTDPASCDRASLVPGGSAFCPQIRMESPVAAVEVTYSYSGTPLGTLTFQVYFQPSALPAVLREDLAAGRKPGRAQLARYFEVATRRDAAPRFILDPSRSYLCSGTYIDGNWQPDDPDCDIIIRTHKVQGLSDFLTVTVTPVARPDVAAAHPAR